MVLGISSAAYFRTKVLLVAFVAGAAAASAQSLAPPLAEMPSSSLSPTLDQPMASLPPAASNLLAPTSGNQTPTDDLGANLQSTSSNPFVFAGIGDRPAAAIDTMIRGTTEVGARTPGQLSSRSLYTSTQAARWGGSSATSTMKGVQLAGAGSANMPAVGASSWGTAATSSAGAPNADEAMAALTAANKKAAAARKAAAIKNRNWGVSSGVGDTASLFQFQPGNEGSQSAFGQTAFGSLGSQDFLNPDLIGVLYTRRAFSKSPDKIGLPGQQNEMSKLQQELHPATYYSSYGKKTGRVTMKSRIEQEGQSNSVTPTLPPIFFISQ